MLSRKGLLYLSLTVWLIADVKVRAYKSGSSGGYCFTISDFNNNNERTEQSNAQQRCQSNGTQLVEISNKDIQYSLITFIKSAYSQRPDGWTVLTSGKRSSDGSCIRLNGNNIAGITVYEQTDASYAYGYLKSTTSGFDIFTSKPAVKKTGFICTGLSDCWGGVTINGQCYKSFSETLSWYDARNRCLDGGGDLASFDHITTNAGFNALNGSWLSTAKSYWIGIRREWWTWQSSNTDVKYSDWITDHPVNDFGRANSDCLCLSTTEWKWIECGCSQQLPFVCILRNLTTPTASTKSTKTNVTSITVSTAATPSTFTRSSTIPEGSGVSSPTIPPTLTTKSTPDANKTEKVEQSNVLSGATIGIGVGVGVGGALVIFALVAVAIILCRKRCPVRCPQKKPTSAKIQPPDILMVESINADSNYHGIENPYAMVVPSSPECNRANTNDYENFNQSPTVYAQLGFSADTQIRRQAIESVFIVPGKTKPSIVSGPLETDGATNHFIVNGDVYAGVTKA